MVHKGTIKGGLPIHPFLTYKKKVPLIRVPADRAENYEKRTNTLRLDLHTFYIRAYIRILPAQKYEEDGSRLYKMEVDYLGLDAYEYPHCAYYHLGSSKAVKVCPTAHSSVKKHCPEILR